MKCTTKPPCVDLSCSYFVSNFNRNSMMEMNIHGDMCMFIGKLNRIRLRAKCTSISNWEKKQWKELKIIVESFAPSIGRYVHVISISMNNLPKCIYVYRFRFFLSSNYKCIVMSGERLLSTLYTIRLHTYTYIVFISATVLSQIEFSSVQPTWCRSLWM